MENDDETSSEEVFNNLLDRQQLRIKTEVMEREGKPMWNLFPSTPALLDIAYFFTRAWG